MSQGMRDMLSNRRFSIPLIILLGTIFVGLILVGIVLIVGAGNGNNGEVAQATSTTAPQPTALFTSSPTPTESSTPRPTPTLVPLGTSVSSAGDQATPAATEAASPTTGPAAQATPGTGSAAQATATPLPEDELADTGVGWGLVIISGIGLAALVLFARHLRLAQP